MGNDKIRQIIHEAEKFLNEHEKGEIKHVYLSPCQKEYFQKELATLLKEKNFRIVPGIFKPGYLEHDYYLEECK